MLVVAVISAPDERDRRDTLRQSWLLWAKERGHCVMFVMGLANLEESQRARLADEQRAHGDLLLLAGVEEDYRSLTPKMLALFVWLAKHVAFSFLLKADVDTFVRLDRIDDILHESLRRDGDAAAPLAVPSTPEALYGADSAAVLRDLPASRATGNAMQQDERHHRNTVYEGSQSVWGERSVPTKRLYWGYFDGRAHPKRQGKWGEYSWVICDHYLPYAVGGGYVLSTDVVTALASAAPLLSVFANEGR